MFQMLYSRDYSGYDIPYERTDYTRDPTKPLFQTSGTNWVLLPWCFQYVSLAYLGFLLRINLWLPSKLSRLTRQHGSMILRLGALTRSPELSRHVTLVSRVLKYMLRS